MKNWKKKLTLVTTADIDQVPSTAELMAARAEVLKLDAEVEFRETSLEHYEADMLATEQERSAFVEDLYDWADSNDVWVEWQRN